MPGEIDTGGPRVLHHNSDWPISIYQKSNNLIKYNTENYIINHNIIIRKKIKKYKFKNKKYILLFKTYYKNYDTNDQNEIKNSQYISKCTSKKVDELDISNNHLELDNRDNTNHTNCDFHLQFNFIQKNQNNNFNFLAIEFKKNSINNTLILSDINKDKNNININNNNKASRPNNYAWLVSQSDKSSKCKLNCENIIKNEKKITLNNHNNIKNKKSYSFIYLLLLFVIILFGNTKKMNKTNIKIISFGTLLNIANGAPADYDAAIRAERSANLSHITGPSKKIQIFIKNRYLQIFPDGTVNGSSGPSNYSEYNFHFISFNLREYVMR